jgi:hypothetical protein
MGRKARQPFPSPTYLFVDVSEVDGYAELVVLNLGAGYVLCFFYQPLVHLKEQIE